MPARMGTENQAEHDTELKFPTNTTRPSLLIKNLSSSVAPRHFVPPKTQSALQT
jgi:hypothetical protein